MGRLLDTLGCILRNVYKVESSILLAREYRPDGCVTSGYGLVLEVQRDLDVPPNWES